MINTCANGLTIYPYIEKAMLINYSTSVVIRFQLVLRQPL